MADPRPLNRKELAEFLPDQRAIRAFEKLFDLVPSDLETLLVFAESAYSAAQSAKTQNILLQQRIDRLELQITLLTQPANIDNLTKRVDILETLQG